MSFSLKKISLAFLFFETHLLFCTCAHVLEPSSWKINPMEVTVKRSCDGKIGRECLWEDQEMEMDSEINRRILAVQKKYISYEALKRDEVPCFKPGASYYNCHAPVPAHPYVRGCTIITGCERDTHY